jgi:uncharacterized membrane protein
MKLIKNKHLIPAFILSFLGFVDAAYLTIIHYRSQVPNCSIVKGCEVVTTSQFSTLFGIPIAIFGALFFLVLSIFAILIITHPHKRWVHYFSWAALAGLIISLILFLIQLIILKAFCQFCVGTEIISLIVFSISVAMVSHVRKGEKLGHF